MKIYFITKACTNIADEHSLLLEKIKGAILKYEFVSEVKNPDEADALIIQEKNSFKNFRYIRELLEDPFISKYISKIFTLNTDDCATALLRGLYTSVPKSRLSPRHNASIPFATFFNEQAFDENIENISPAYLAGWRGNTYSNSMRPKMVEYLKGKPDCRVEITDSWLNHDKTEKKDFVDLILDCKFSLCPGGWAPTSFRIYESMALGRCPVIIADNFSPPKGPDWSEFALFFPENKIKDLHAFLLEHEPLSSQLGLKAKEAWHEYFRAEVIADYYAKSLIKLIAAFPECSKESEIKRWNSLKFYWSNDWSLLQRIVKKIKDKASFSK